MNKDRFITTPLVSCQSVNGNLFVQWFESNRFEDRTRDETLEVIARVLDELKDTRVNIVVDLTHMPVSFAYRHLSRCVSYMRNCSGWDAAQRSVRVVTGSKLLSWVLNSFADVKRSVFVGTVDAACSDLGLDASLFL